MKKLIAVLVSCALLLAALPMMTLAAFPTKAQDGITYYLVLDDGTAELHGYHCGDAEIAFLPSEVDGYTVSAIGYQCNTSGNIGTLVIPETIREIHSWAFSASHIQNFAVAENNETYTAVDGVLFTKDKATLVDYPSDHGTTYTVPSSVKTIGDWAFARCEAITNVTLPHGLVTIGEAAFKECRSLGNIAIPVTVRSIGSQAFEGCHAFTQVVIPDGVEELGSSTFLGCNTLKVYIPDSVTKFGYEVFSYATVTIYASSGSQAEAYVNSDSTVNAFATLQFVPRAWAYYPDVLKGEWYCDAVGHVSDKGYMSGYGSGYFGPAGDLQRQDFVVTLARVAGADLSAYATADSGLSDVKAGSYYAPAVAWAVENGIITGYQSGKFGVGDKITREQVCTILYRFKNSPAVENIAETLTAFPDSARVSGYATDAMAWAVQNGVISGSKGKLAPTSGASRAQIATILMRMDQNGLL